MQCTVTHVVGPIRHTTRQNEYVYWDVQQPYQPQRRVLAGKCALAVYLIVWYLAIEPHACVVPNTVLASRLTHIQ